MTEQTKSEGKIIKVQKEKGFGFIISPEHKFVKFFFHWTGLVQSTLNFTQLEEGMKVRFVPVLDSNADNLKEVAAIGASMAESRRISRGPRAVQIEVIEETKNDASTETHSPDSRQS